MGALLDAVAGFPAAEHQRRRVALRTLADTDPPTGLLNGRALVEHMATVPDREARRGELMAVLHCDLDGLKAINDRHGHHVGDTVLQAVAARMSGSVRAGDLVARVGGDEFVVILNGVRDQAAAIATAQKMADRVPHELLIDGSTVLPTVSIGVAMVDDDNAEAVMSSTPPVNSACNQPGVPLRVIRARLRERTQLIPRLS
jgi:diguanylate cyclase (GGDEF)-like protein